MEMLTMTKQLTKPTVHLNGTSREALAEGRRMARTEEGDRVRIEVPHLPPNWDRFEGDDSPLS
jgi:hypothetical protein